MIVETVTDRIELPDLGPALRAKIAQRKAEVAILGLGYVGLSLARTLCGAGYPVVGIDVDAFRIERLRERQSYVAHISNEEIAKMLQVGFEPSWDFERLADADIVLLCVPTPLTQSREPDLSFVVRAGELCADRLRPGQLLVLESTTYPGTTRRVLGPILERTGLRVQRDFFLAYSPEREDPGNPTFQTKAIPKVVAGVNPESAKLARQFYVSAFAEVVPVASVEVAEACKLLENTYRAVNIGLINELKTIFERLGLDVYEVIEAAKTKPFGFEAFYPGPGIGGHCIPVDPFYLSWLARRQGLSARFIELAGEVNASMTGYVLGHLVDALNERGKAVRASKILLLGVAYKKDSDDTRLSPAWPLAQQLLERGASVGYHDPRVQTLPADWRHTQLQPTNQVLTAELLAEQDAVVVVTDHSCFDWPWILEHAPLVIDTRNATRNFSSKKVLYT